MSFVLAFGVLDVLAFGAPTPNAAFVSAFAVFVLAFGVLDVLAFGAQTPNAAFVSAFAVFVLAFGAPAPNVWCCAAKGAECSVLHTSGARRRLGPTCDNPINSEPNRQSSANSHHD
jgi:hypothetical protein